MFKFSLPLAALLLFVSSAAFAQNPVIKAIARDAVDICLLDLQGGDKAALMAQRGFAQEGRPTRRIAFYKKDYSFNTNSGQTASIKPVISISRKEDRKRLSRCGLRPKMRAATADLVYKEMQRYAQTLGFQVTPGRQNIIFKKGDFTFGLSGREGAYDRDDVAIIFIRL